MLLINNRYWHLPKDIFGILVYYFSQEELRDYNLEFIPTLSPQMLGYGKAPIPISGRKFR